MNRKIMFLLAGFLFACFTAMADTDNTIKLKVGENEGLYQIVSVSTGNVVWMNSQNELGVIHPTSTSTPLANKLWYVQISEDPAGSPRFDFTNKASGLMLNISLEGAMAEVGYNVPSAQLSVEGGLNGWTFSNTYTDGVEIAKPLFTYYKPDSVIALRVVGSEIVGVKLGANEVENVSSADNSYQFSLRKPAPIPLKVADLNTMMGLNPNGKSFKLKFDKEVDSNVFANELTAVSDTLYDDYHNPELGNYVTLVNTSTGNYLRVDTAYHDTAEGNFLQITDTASAKTYIRWQQSPAMANGLVTDNYAFRFNYSPFSDSIFISVYAAVLEKGSRSWATSLLTTKNQSPEKLQIYVKDLTDSNILTVGTGSPYIVFDTTSYLPLVSTRTTLPSDLYVIRSTDGHYLSVPLDGDTTVQWVALDKEADAWAMPSFQWVIEKNATVSDSSGVKITNREFGNGTKVFYNVLLDKVTPVELEDQKGVSKSVGLDGFFRASADVKAERYLGYKYLTDDEMAFYRYKFRCLKDAPDEEYIGVNDVDDDPVLYAGAKSDFLLQQVGSRAEEYGYTSQKVSGLEPLRRMQYTLKLNYPKMISAQKATDVVLDTDNHFAVSASGTPAPFLLKAISEKSIGHATVPFYAFIRPGTNAGDTVKVGIDDTDRRLKGQSLTGSPTAAFSVEVGEYHLYRKLRLEKEGVAANNNPDTVNFFSATPSGGSIEFPGGKSAIYVDTAYVNRGTGAAKPQYLLAVDVRLIPELNAVACTKNHSHGYDLAGNALDEYTCPYAIRHEGGYVRGRYLMSDDYNSGGELSFVEAIHKDDTLYILTAEEAKLADPVDFRALTGTSIRLDNNEHKNAVFSFRFTGSDPEKFLIEAKQYDGEGIGPMQGGWIKFENGQPVVSQMSFDEARANGTVFTLRTSTGSPKANDAVLSSDAPAVDGWYTRPVTLTAPAGYTIALKGNPDYAASFVWATEGSNELTYFLKQDGTGNTEDKTIVIKLDLTDPSISAIVNYLEYTLHFADGEKGSGIGRLFIDGREVAVSAGISSYSNTGSDGKHTALLTDCAGRIATVDFTLTAKVDPPVPVFYTVTLPAVEGVQTDPPAGDYTVESWDNFGFSLVLEEGYRQHSQPVVKANGDIITPRISDGKYIIKYVWEDKAVEIEGIAKDDPVANAQINADIRIRSVGRMIYIDLPAPLSCRLTNLAGKTIRRLQLSSGENCIDGLAAGIYIINLADMPGIKVICKE